ncbi:GumC family protein [Sphingomonas sp. IC4-52]|uniref:GumC family protein n=1 Tax=Sphingomonas sp. IC4-52 TaxID=2887202 RepID=UPI001D109A9E|nr:polysaccharide biosynthesis tyrosine autokinase [Sphingomonas sp. IC4-52]MCC2981673.1 polysaccharide biosynthesis tyrosine autokinase [Sphingomonas sp. IC4-52]
MKMLSSQALGGNVSASTVAGPATLTDETMPLLRQYLRIAMRRRYAIIAAVVGCVLLGLIITLLMTPKYTATSTIEISRESDKVTNFQGVEREASVADQEFYQTQYGLLQSRSLSERVAAQLRLIDDPEFFEMFGISQDKPAFQQTNGRYPANGRAARQRVAGEVLLKNLSIDPTRLSRLVDIRFTSPDADFSARVANAWAENFIKTNLERKIQATSYGRDLLQRQLAEYKNRLDQSQRQLVAYASAQQIINLPSQTSGDNRATSERSIVADDLAALNAALSQATADRIQAEARYQQVGRSGASTEALRNVAINNLRQRRAELAAEYQQLMTRFEPGYPAAQAIQSQINQLDRSIAREEGRVTNSLQADYREAVERERALQAKVNQLKSSFLDLRRRSIQYNIYQQEVDTNRALYDGLLQRFKEIGVAGGVGVNNVAVVDPADVPQRPSSPRLLINLAASILAGLVLGAAIALALEQIDEAIADPAEVERRLGLPLLGSVPKVEGATPKEALLDRKSELVDAYLAVQTNLAFTTQHGVPRSFAVTSTRPAEGKSTTALALATTLARAHRRVILVDGDMRSPSVHHLGGVDHDRGLSNFLSGQDDISSLTFEMRELGLTAMSAGPIPPNAAELLTGNRLSLLIERLLETYDHVVIDSPPVMGLADAPLIASRVEGVIYAVESHGIRATLVKTALGRLASANARIVGGVLTKFEPRKANYGYGYEYGYGYGRDRRADAA